MIETDAVVIGAGPVGLFQAFQLGLQDIACHMVDALPHAGGQCVELYPHKPIYDIPALPAATGLELTERLLAQLAPFKVPQHLGQTVQSLESTADGRWILTTEHLRFDTRTVFIAAGVGAFAPRKAPLPSLTPFEGRQVLYHAVHPSQLQGQAVVVWGGDEAAVETAVYAAQSGRCSRVTLLHRTTKLQASADTLNAFQQQLAAGNIELLVGQPLDAQVEGDGTVGQTRLTGLVVATGDEEQRTLPLDLLLPRLGLSPKLGPLADWGLAMERKQLTVQPDTFATQLPGVYAVGDINTYPGKRKLIVCGFHEATLAAFAAAEYLRPGERVLLQYTTTSPRLHALLGVGKVT